MKTFLPVFLLISLSSCDFPKVVSASFAKEFCSCHFVVKQSNEFCENYAKQIIPISSYGLDKNIVWAKGLFIKTEVQYLGKKLGCTIKK